MHGLLGQSEASYGIMDVLHGGSEFVEFCCYTLGPAGVVDSAVGDGW